MSRQKRPPRHETERSLVAWLETRPETAGLIGDDAATFPRRGPHVVTIDSQIEGVHFPAGLEPELVARRLLAVNLSDLAAMGARPAHAFLALSAPPGFEHRRFFSALLAGARRYGLTLAGGDLARAPVVTASLALIGHRWPRSRGWLLRSAGRPGDQLYLGGTAGESALGLELLRRGACCGRRGGVTLPASIAVPAGLAAAATRAVRRHLRPSPQLELGRALSRRRRVAAIDVSDGLALDLHRLCRESGAGAVIELGALPRAPRFDALAARLGLDADALALGGGEDYVLLFALAPTASPPEPGCRRIGVLTRDRAITLIDRAGGAEPLPDRGWDHLSARPGTEPAGPPPA